MHAVGIGAGLVGSFLLFRQAQKWWAQHKIDKLRQQAANGQIPPRQFLDAVLATGQPIPGGPQITIDDARRMRCVDLFPPNVLAAIPQGMAALAQMRADGTCL